MKIMIHACPQRMWYVVDFLIPELKRQGADEIRVWNDVDHKGNLQSCLESFASCEGDGGTWHIQDDVLPGRNCVKLFREHDQGVVYGFCHEPFGDDPGQTGTVYMEDAWHSFQCVRIPDAYARDFAEWMRDGRGEKQAYYPLWTRSGKMDDSAFREYLLSEHGTETAYNLKPNPCEHVDWIIGGSMVNRWRGYFCRAHWWNKEDEDLVTQLKTAVMHRVL